ncbi:MAG: hypothetical protein AAF821_01795 [Cyanobacteria bacterium P01_D01_bin.156]
MQRTNNSGSKFLVEKIASVVSDYPIYPYQLALSNKAIQNLLLDYVECQLKQLMPELEYPDYWQQLPRYVNKRVDLELHLDSYIYWGIEYIIQNQFDVLMDVEKSSNPTWNAQDMNKGSVPSNWFG